MNNSSSSSSSSSSSCNQSSYRSAIALNNIGVSLLELRCYQQASETFKDAVSLIKAFTPQNDHSLQQTLHSARQRLAKPQPIRREVVEVDVVANTVSPKALSSLLGASRCDSGSSRAFAIRIEDFGYTTTSEFIASIILHNFGVIYYCLSKAAAAAAAARTNKTGAAVKKYSNGALRLFRISHSLFAKAFTDNTESRLQFMNVMAVLLNNLITSLRENELFAEARHFRSMLDHIRWTIHESQAIFCLEKGAAAAA